MKSMRFYGPKDFPRIAKDMGFSFSLRRGRVDWQKIGAIDIDRLVQDRDIVSLQENLINIINYNLDSEYDVKILDPNFVKLFKLAQLSIDYLMYSEQHVYNCIELEQQHSRKYVKEVDKWKRECKKKDDEIKNFKKKFKLSHDEIHTTEIRRHPQHFRTASGEGVDNFFKCSQCGKAFLTAAYLEAHHGRRHPSPTLSSLPAAQSLDPFRSETERLQSEIKELKERLNNTERLLHKESFEDVRESNNTKGTGDEGTNTDTTNWAEEEKRRMKEWQEAQQQKYLEEIADLKTVFYNEIKMLKNPLQVPEPATTPACLELLEQIQKQNDEIVALREQLAGQSTPDIEIVQSRLEAQEKFWKSRLKLIETEHKKELEDLKIQLNQAKESQNDNHLIEYERKIMELMDHATRQDEALKAQAEQILRLTELRQTHRDSVTTNTSNLKSQSDENVKADPSVTFAELAARIDNAIHASKRSSKNNDSVSANQTTQLLIRDQTAKAVISSHPSPPRSTVASKNIQSPTESSSSSSHSPKKSVDISNTTVTSKEPKEIHKSTKYLKASASQEESSSDSSPQTGKTDVGSTSMYGLVEDEVPTQRHSSHMPNEAWNTKDVRGSDRSLQDSKDSGLDSPKRLPTGHVTSVTKFNTFKESSSVKKTTPFISRNEDEVDNTHKVAESEIHEDEEEETEEEEEEEEEEEAEEEEETASDEETIEESETETDTGAELAVRSIHSMEDALQQNPQILLELKEDLRDILARRLRELGVDPEWKGIPAGTFRQKMETLKHHQNITAKRHKSFFKIRKRLTDVLERRLSNSKAGNQHERPKNDAKDRERDIIQQNRMAVSKLVGKVKTKALNVLKRSTGKLSSHSTRESRKTNSPEKTVLSHRPKSAVTSGKQIAKHKEQRTNVASTRKSSDLNKKRAVSSRAEMKTKKPKKSEVSATLNKKHSRSVEQTTEPNVTMVTSTPLKKTTVATGISPRGSILKGSKTSNVSESVLSKKNVKTPSISSMEEEEENDEERDIMEDEANEEMDDMSDIDIEDASTRSRGKQNIAHTQSSSSLLRQSTITKNRDLSSDQESPRGSKSALKTASSSSLGSITKKKVLFVDQENKSTIQKAQETDDGRNLHQTKSLPWNVSKVVATARLARSAETLAVTPSTSWDSLPLRSPNKSVTFASNLTSQSSPKSSDSDSDWGLPSTHDNMADTEKAASLSTTNSYEKINLSTKQSTKIAQISKNIEKQLSMSRSKPPTGGVEAMFRATEATTSEKNSAQSNSSSTSLGSFVVDSNRENNMNIGNTKNTTMSAPIPKPRSNQSATATQQTASKITLSDWDLEDFDD